jgi:hypothetical protein
MKRFRLLPILGLLLCAAPAWSQAINYASSTSGTNSAAGATVGTTTNCSTCGVTLNVQAGSSIFVGIRYNVAASVTSVTDTAGNTFVLLTGSGSGGAGNVTALYYVCSAIANAADAFTLTLSGSISQSKNITPVVYTGGLASSCPDGNGNGGNGSSTAPATGNLTASVTNDLLFSYFFCGAGGETIGTSFALRKDEATIAALAEDRGNGGGLGTGTFTGTGNCTSGAWGISAGLFLAAPAAGGGGMGGNGGFGGRAGIGD